MNEGTDVKPKWGYVATVPGSSLLIRLDVVAHDAFSLVIHFLQSYTDMGSARVECAAGCECKASQVDAWHAVHNSQTALFYIGGVRRENGARECNIRVTVLNETTTAGHKFKVRRRMRAPY